MRVELEEIIKTKQDRRIAATFGISMSTIITH